MCLGWFYVAVTAFLMFVFMKKHLERLREAQTDAERNEKLKTAFIQNISHELRTPMNSIIGFSDIVTNENNDPSLQEYLNIINNSSHQLLEVVNDVLDASMLEAGTVILHQNKVVIQELLNNLFMTYERMVPTSVKLKLTTSLTHQNQFLVTDEIKLKRIMVNLLSNAIKFTEKGEIELGWRMNNNSIEFFVQDTGLGIESHEQKDIFKRFEQGTSKRQKNNNGTGLGLAICERLVAILGGQIGLKSEVGKGSKFYFTIPIKY